MDVLEGVHELETEPGRASGQISLFANPDIEPHDKGSGVYWAKVLVSSDLSTDHS
jgi:hypothetical protein